MLVSSDRHFELMLSTPREETEELERSSALHAVVAEPDLELKAGHIYVIPPGTS